MLAREVSIPGFFPKGPNLRSSRSRVRILLIRRLPWEHVCRYCTYRTLRVWATCPLNAEDIRRECIDSDLQPIRKIQ